MLVDECEIECWKHGSSFSLATGEPLTLPATLPVPTYPVCIDDGDVYVEVRTVELRRSSVTVLEIRDSHAGVSGKEILRGIDLTVASGEVHAVMGPNGSGKSTLSHVLMGRPGYEVLGGTVTLDGVDILALEPWQRAEAGLFLALQYPTEVPGVSLEAMLAAALRAQGRDVEGLPPSSLSRGRAHRLRRALPRPSAERRPVGRREEAQRDRPARGARARDRDPRRARLRARRRRPRARVRDGSRRRRRSRTSACSRSPTTCDCCTSCTRIEVHILVQGRIVKSGDDTLAAELEAHGYAPYLD